MKTGVAVTASPVLLKNGGNIMTIGFIGNGNMGRAIISGIVEKKVAEPSNIMVYDIMVYLRQRIIENWQNHQGFCFYV